MSVPSLPSTSGLPAPNPGETEQQWLQRVFGIGGSNTYTPPIAPTTGNNPTLIGGMAQAAQARIASDPCGLGAQQCAISLQSCGLGPGNTSIAGCLSYLTCTAETQFSCAFKTWIGDIEAAAGTVGRIALVNVLLVILLLAGLWYILER